MSDQPAFEMLLRHATGRDDLALETGIVGELTAEVAAEHLLAAISALSASRHFHHLSAITALDDGERIQVLYHLWMGTGVTLRVSCQREHPALPSLGSLWPAALWYEREASEMLGIAFEGHPHPQPLLLPEDWSGPPPLRKEPQP